MITFILYRRKKILYVYRQKSILFQGQTLAYNIPSMYNETMNKFFAWILKHKLIVISAFVVIIALSVVGFMFVEKNSDIVSYLPKDSDTNISKDKIMETFSIEGDGVIAVSGVTEDYMKTFTTWLTTDCKVKVKDAEEDNYIRQIVWLGMFDSLKSVSADSYNVLRDKYLRDEDGTPVYVVTVYFNSPSSSEETVATLDAIEDYLNKTIASGADEDLDDEAQILGFAFGGGSANSRTLLKSSLGELPKYLGIAVLLILIILLLTTKSAFEPVIFIGTLGISIVINMGSNVLMPNSTISTITFSAAAILQLALSMDYSIFLMHAFYEEKLKTPDPYTAMLNALPKTLKAVLASALTTIGGFVALFVIRFRMGFDLGFVLAKGVLFSLITVMLLQPVLILWSQKPIAKLSHKMIIDIKPKRMANYAKHAYLPTLILAVVLLIPTFIMQFKVPLAYTSMSKPNLNPTKAEAVLLGDANQVLLMVPVQKEQRTSFGGGEMLTQDCIDLHYQFVDKLSQIDDVKDVFCMFNVLDWDLFSTANYVGASALKQLNSFMQQDENGKWFTIYSVTIGEKATDNNPNGVPIDTEDPRSYVALDAIRTLALDTFPSDQGEVDSVFMTGMSQGAYDLSKITPGDFLLVSILSAVLILIILVLTFRKLSLSAIVLLVIELGIFINLSIVFLLGYKINFMSYIILTAIQLGATVDYAILLVSKYLESKKTMPIYEAVPDAVKRATPSIFTSAAVLISACMAVYFITSNTIVSEITRLIAIGAVLSTVLVLTVIPSVLWAGAKFAEYLAKKNLKAPPKNLRQMPN